MSEEDKAARVAALVAFIKAATTPTGARDSGNSKPGAKDLKDFDHVPLHLPEEVHAVTTPLASLWALLEAYFVDHGFKDVAALASFIASNFRAAALNFHSETIDPRLSLSSGESFPAYSDACGSSSARRDAMFRKNNLFLNTKKKKRRGKLFLLNRLQKQRSLVLNIFPILGFIKSV